MHSWTWVAGLAMLALPFACAEASDAPNLAGGVGGSGASGGTSGDASDDQSAGSGGSGASDSGFNVDAPGDSSVFDPDAACATAFETATPEVQPVDIIWAVDNSSSMQPAIAEIEQGLNDFAALIAAKSLDYRVIMLSLRGKTSVMIGGSARYPVCIPPPLSADTNCSDGAQFFQSSVDIRSIQPLEQILGTLGQTSGYTAGEEKGGEAWLPHLRTNATKTFVVVSDDNSRLQPNDFEHFSGGKNPYNSLTLPPGILEPMWNGLFDDYLFSALYGWGSDSDPNLKCQYPGGSSPPSAGGTYTTLVQKTGGVRAQICAGASAWGPFFDAVAQAVVKNTKLACEVALPSPSNGVLDPAKINVVIVGNTSTTTLSKVSDAAACDASGGWYYDDDAAPTKVLLCPASCDLARAENAAGSVQIGVQFGCKTVVK